MKKSLIAVYVGVFSLLTSNAQTLKFEGNEFEKVNAIASIDEINGEKVIRLERDMAARPYDLNNIAASADEPTFIRLKNLNLVNGVIEVKVLSRLLPSAPVFARGFIGVAYRINENNTAYESIYLRPTNGRAEDQFRRNHTVQYYAYPDYKFNRLRAESKGEYETYADIGLDEWINLRIEIKDKKAVLFINNQKHPSFIVGEMLGSTTSGSIGLWVDIGTEGYFKDLKVIKQ